jgi:hypothetical protein
MRIGKRLVVGGVRPGVILAALVAVLSLVGGSRTAPAEATGATVTWVSPFVIQNIDSKDAVDVSVAFYSITTPSSTPTLTYDAGGLKKGASVPIRPQTITGLAPDQYSVVISSDAQISAIVNEVGGVAAGSYDGLNASKLTGTTSIGFPNIVRNYSGFNSPLYIQNAGTATATGTLTFYKFSDGSQAAQVPLSLLPAQSAVIDPASVNGLVDGTQYSAVAVSTNAQPLAGMVNEMTSSGLTVMAYDGLLAADGGLSLYMPNITRNYFGWNTPFVVQNDGTSSTNITATYYKFTDGSLAATFGPYNIGQNLSHPFRPYSDTPTTGSLQDGTQYSVVVTSDSQPIISIVNEVNSTTEAMSYRGFSTTGSTLNVSMPNITRNYVGWNTPFVVQNIGTGSTNVTATYYKFSDGSLAATFGPYSVGQNLSHAFRPYSDTPATGSLQDNTQYSVVVTSDSQSIVSVVNETNPAYDSMAYEGINY